MPSRRTDAFGRRAVAAVAVPTALAGVAGALVLAAPAHAAGPSPTLPFPTAICGISSPSSKAVPAPSAKSHSPSTTPKPSTSATTPKAGTLQSPSPSPSASASGSAGAAGAAAGATTPTPSTSSSSSSGGFWGWVNGVWTWIFGSAPITHSPSAPAVQAAAPLSGTSANKVNKVVPAVVTKAAQQVKAAAPISTSPSAQPSCIPSSALKKNAATANGDTAAQLPWHLSTPSMTMYNLTYNGIATVQLIDGTTEQALDFTAEKVNVLSMVTYSHQGGTKLQFVNGGTGQTVTLQTVHLLTTTMTAKLFGLVAVTFSPSSPPPLPVGLTVPIPVLFTDVEAENAFLNTQSIVIPGFDGHGN